MRLVVGLFAVLLSGSLAHAAPKVPLRVVRMLPESHQALLFDKVHATHVLADVGATIEGYVVEDIDDDQVTLSANGTQVVLAAPDQSWRRRRAEAEGAPAAGEPADVHVSAGSPAPAPAKANLGKLAPLPVDPYGEPAVRVVDAPRTITAGEDGVRVTSAAPAPPSSSPADTSFSAGWTVPTPSPGIATMGTDQVAPVGSAGQDLSPVTTAAAQITTVTDAGVVSTTLRTPPRAAKGARKARTHATPADDASAFADAVAPAPSGGQPSTATTDWVPAEAADAMAAAMVPVADPEADAQPPAHGAGSTVFLGRREVDGALADVGALAAAVHGSFTPTGARLESVAPGSLFAKAGLRAGDTITAVDGKPLRSLDDAAEVYARAGSAKAVTVAVTRAGKPVTLRMSIQ